jgi:hypothetical protein
MDVNTSAIYQNLPLNDTELGFTTVYTLAIDNPTLIEVLNTISYYLAAILFMVTVMATVMLLQTDAFSLLWKKVR